MQYNYVHPAYYDGYQAQASYVYPYMQNPFERYGKNMPKEKSGHTHSHLGATTCQDGHIHAYETLSSPPIPLPNGYHTHYVEVRTTESDGHIHIIKGFTQPSKS